MTVETLYQMARGLHRAKLNVDETLVTAIRGTAALFGALHGCIVLLDGQAHVTRMTIMESALDARIEEAFWQHVVEGGIIREVINRWRPVIAPNIAADPTWPKLTRYPDLRWHGTGAALPIMRGDSLIGVVAIVHPQVNAFGEREKIALLEVSDLISEALDNALSFEAIERGYAQLLSHQDKDDTARLRHDLTAMIYHDLRAPLTNIHTSLGTLEMLLHANNPAKAEKLLHIAMQSSRRLIRMVKSLLDIDRLEAGRAVLHRKQTRLSALFNDLALAVRPLAEDSDQALTLEAADDLPTVSVDYDMILRVVINLVENAIKHTPPGGHITVSAVERGALLMVRVRDTGPGIPAAHRQDVFDKYFRIRNTDTATLEAMKIGVPGAGADTPDVSTRGGVGLGLAFCRLAVEAHGGSIFVEDAPGGGAVFVFSIPLESEELDNSTVPYH
jgi:signal transduction histidine kinase